MNKRICCLIDSLGSGGAQRQMVLLARLLKQHGYEVTVVTYYDYGHFRQQLTDHGIEEIQVLGKSKLRRPIGIRRTIRRMRPDAIISFLKTPNLCGAFASPGVSRRIPFIASLRKVDPQPTPKLWTHYQTYRVADAVVCNSNTQADFIKKNYAWLRGKTHVITNCVDFDRFPIASENSLFKGMLANDDKVKVSVVASNIQRKNAMKLIEALHLVRKSRPGSDITVDWFGKRLTEAEDPLEFDYDLKTIDRISELGLKSHFRFRGVTSDVTSALRRSNVSVLPSLTEGFPNAICEAMTCGLPVLASRICDNIRLVDHGAGGYLFDPNCTKDIADTIVRFADTSVEDRRKMSLRNLEFAKREFSPTTFCQRYVALLGQVLR